MCGSAHRLSNPTPYQPDAFTGGYKDAHIRDNIYFVEFNGNGYTPQTTVIQYFHRRAKEVCQQNGYRTYKIRGERDISTQVAIGSAGVGSVNVSTINKPAIAGYVECYK